jgi:hypothetical protein
VRLLEVGDTGAAQVVTEALGRLLGTENGDAGGKVLSLGDARQRRGR